MVQRPQHPGKKKTILISFSLASEQAQFFGNSRENLGEEAGEANFPFVNGRCHFSDTLKIF